MGYAIPLRNVAAMALKLTTLYHETVPLSTFSSPSPLQHKHSPMERVVGGSRIFTGEHGFLHLCLSAAVFLPVVVEDFALDLWGGAEIEQQADSMARGVQIVQQLGFMDGYQFIDSLEFNDDFSETNKILGSCSDSDLNKWAIQLAHI